MAPPHGAKANSSRQGCGLPTERRSRFLPDGSAPGDRAPGARQGAIIARNVPELNTLSRLSVVAILLSRPLVTAGSSCKSGASQRYTMLRTANSSNAPLPAFNLAAMRALPGGSGYGISISRNVAAAHALSEVFRPPFLKPSAQGVSSLDCSKRTFDLRPTHRRGSSR
jgi:hypothetical protein